MRRAFWLAGGLAALAAVIVAGAILVLDPFSGSSGDGGDAGESSLQKTLRKMVLLEGDLPETLIKDDESFTSNEQLTASSTDPEARKALLESWGRLLGYEITYGPGADPGALPVKGVDVSSSLYKTARGAGESFADAVKTAEETDWAENYAALKEFRQERVNAKGLADEIVWLRLSGLQPATSGPPALVTDDLIFFRIGTERGFLRVLASSTEMKDPNYLHSTVESWLRALIKNVRAALPGAADESGG